MSAAALRPLLQAARVRRAGIALALALPWTVVAVAAGWRLSDGHASVAAAACVAMALVAAGCIRASTRRLDLRWLQRTLDARHPGLEDSSALLAADPSTLSALGRLQRERVLQRLPAAGAAGLRAPWPWRRLLGNVAIAAGIATALLCWPESSPSPAAATGPAASVSAAAPTALALVERRLEVTPPAYTGLPAQGGEALSARVPEGTRLAWTLRFVPRPDAVALEFLDGRRIALQRDGDAWRAQANATTPGLYRIATASTGPWGDGTLHRIDVTPDRPPTIRVTAPAQTLSLRTPGQRHWTFAFEASDDHAIAATAELHLTMTEGSGEDIGFREEVRRIDGRGGRRSKRFEHRLDLDALGLSEGDDLIVHAVVRETRPGGAQSTRSASHILRWPPPEAAGGGGFDGVLQRVLPAYFASQRQIILDAEALIAARPGLADDDFAKRSDAIGVDQRLLRLRYGQFLGEESEGAPVPPAPAGAAKEDLPPPPMLLPTNDAEDEAEAWREMVESATADAPAHEAGSEASGDGVHAHDDGHGHADGPPDSGPGRSGFGVGGDVLEQFGHTHDIPEAATLLDPKTRSLLRRALGEMWQSELALRQARPRDALPPANRALALVKEIQQADRIHLARTGTALPPVDFARRLSGKREGIASRRDALEPARTDEDVHAALWRSLATGDAGRDTDLAALQAWLAANTTHVEDPLALLAALDVVQREPACADCRERLRALLWPLATPPPAAPAPRPAADAVGRAYLDALDAGDAGDAR